MLSVNIQEEFSALPPEAQRQVVDFIAFIKSRYQTNTSASNVAPIEQSFGIVKAKRTVSLEQMEAAIEHEGSLL